MSLVYHSCCAIALILCNVHTKKCSQSIIFFQIKILSKSYIRFLLLKYRQPKCQRILEYTLKKWINKNTPVCVLRCLFKSDGLSKPFLQKLQCRTFLKLLTFTSGFVSLRVFVLGSDRSRGNSIYPDGTVNPRRRSPRDKTQKTARRRIYTCRSRRDALR